MKQKSGSNSHAAVKERNSNSMSGLKNFSGDSPLLPRKRTVESFKNKLQESAYVVDTGHQVHQVDSDNDENQGGINDSFESQFDDYAIKTS